MELKNYNVSMFCLVDGYVVPDPFKDNKEMLIQANIYLPRHVTQRAWTNIVVCYDLPKTTK